MGVQRAHTAPHALPGGRQLVLLVLHLLVALGGYLRYAGAVPANVLDVLPPGPLVHAARGAIVVAFAFTYPMMIFLCRMHIQVSRVDLS